MAARSSSSVAARDEARATRALRARAAVSSAGSSSLLGGLLRRALGRLLEELRRQGRLRAAERREARRAVVCHRLWCRRGRRVLLPFLFLFELALLHLEGRALVLVGAEGEEGGALVRAAGLDFGRRLARAAGSGAALFEHRLSPAAHGGGAEKQASSVVLALCTCESRNNRRQKRVPAVLQG